MQVLDARRMLEAGAAALAAHFGTPAELGTSLTIYPDRPEQRQS